jgi:hypothetical protein
MAEGGKTEGLSLALTWPGVVWQEGGVRNGFTVKVEEA